MKHAVASIILLFSILPAQGVAQMIEHEVLVYRGWGSTLFRSDMVPTLRSTQAPSQELLQTTADRESVMGTNGLDIHVRVCERMAWGIGLGYLRTEQEVRVPDGHRPDHDLARFEMLERSILALGSLRFDWNTGNTRLYSGAQAGIRHFKRWSDRDDLMDPVKQVSFAYQATPLGLRFGGKLAGHVEIGYGHKGILVAGLSYSFSVKGCPHSQ